MDTELKTLHIESLRRFTFFSNGDYKPSNTTRKVWEDNWQTVKKYCAEVSGEADNVWQTHFESIWNLYNEPTRHYHTTVHIEEMLQMLQFLQQSCWAKEILEDQSTAVILLAIFFHDAIYNGKSQTNEEDSVHLFHQFADSVSLTLTLRRQVSSYILATKTHQNDSNDFPLSLFLDLDMAVLGKNTEAYMQYATCIRREYSFVPENIYCNKRHEILNSFLLNSCIYGTSAMKQVCEEQAKRNLLSEINALAEGNIPRVL